MTRELIHTGGVGSNTRFAVQEDGKVIGSVRRDGSRGFVVLGYYNRVIAMGNTLAESKEQALRVTFPSQLDAYASECRDVHQKRLRTLERHFSGRLIFLARKMTAGDKDAQEEIAKLLEGIDAKALSREPATPGQNGACELVMDEQVPALARYPAQLAAE